MTLKHNSNGFEGGKWKHEATRWNQLRFNNEVKYCPEMMEQDGLSNLEYIEHGIIKVNESYLTLIKLETL